MIQRKFDWGTFVADLYVPFRYWKLKLITFLIIFGLFFLLVYAELFVGFHIPYIPYLCVIIAFLFIFVGIYIDKKRNNTLYFGEEENDTLPDDWASYQKIRMRMFGKAWVKSIIALFLAGIVVYVLMEHILKIQDYGQFEVLIAVGIPLTAWWLVLAISLLSIHREDKKWYEKLKSEKKEVVNKWKKILNVLAVIILLFVLFQMLMVFDVVSVPIEYHIFMMVPIMILIIPILYIAIKFQNELKK